MMNEKAKELNMNDTCFKNCHGIDEDGHVMSAYDIAILSCALLNDYPEITKYTTIYMDSLRDEKSSLVNTNKLVRNYSGCTGLKTGSTSLALYNLSASASRNGMDLVAVVMKAPTSAIRFKNASNLLDYGFTNFEYKQLINKNDIVKTISVPKGVNSPIELQAKTDCGVILIKGKDTNIEQVVSVANNIGAPINKGDELGKITYILDGETIAECSLVASQNVPKINIFSMEQNIFKNWATLLR
jgi:D-alanyl-D-alanine carboxypeptidase (penicillin-binding protein 5/6)